MLLSSPTVHDLPRRLLEAIADASTRDVAQSAIVRLIGECGPVKAVALLRRVDDVTVEVASVHHVRESSFPDTGGERHRIDSFLSLGKAACLAGKLQIQESTDTLVAAPIFVRGSAPTAIVLCAEPGQLDLIQQLASMAATHLALADALREVGELEEAMESSAAMLELIERAMAARCSDQAAGDLVDQLEHHLGCDRVAIGRRKGDRPCRLVALSGQDQLDADSEYVQSVEACLEEALLRGEPTLFPPMRSTERSALRAHEHLAKTADVEVIVSAPLTDQDGHSVGGWLLIGDQGRVTNSTQRRFLKTLGPIVVEMLRILDAARPVTALAGLTKSLRQRKSLLFATAGVTCGLLLLCPMSYRVDCQCELQPSTRRFVAAPYDGELAKALVGPGDVVRAAECLARFDGRETAWELESVLVDRDKAQKTQSAALAQQRVSAAQLARLEMDRLELRRKLLERRVANLEVRSPIDGIVLSGDLERTEGAPIKMGQTLFEIAPLDRMVVELAIPEDEIVHIETSYRVVFALDAYPRRKWDGTISKIHPRARLLDNASVFIAEVELDNSSGLLRPGMKGNAKVESQTHPLVWILFHKPYEAAVKGFYGL